jgi:hypothetical protein
MNMKTPILLSLLMAVAVLLSLTGCDPAPDNNGNKDLGEPDIKTFQTKDLFEGKTATIKDERTNCGKQNLEQLGIVTQIENAITAGFNGVEGPMNVVNKNRFRGVFGVAGGVTIIVNNPTTRYEGALTPDAKTMTFHISYLQSNPADINQKIIDAVTFMSDPANFTPTTPLYTNPATITQRR